MEGAIENHHEVYNISFCSVNLHLNLFIFKSIPQSPLKMSTQKFNKLAGKKVLIIGGTSGILLSPFRLHHF
jgi:hypothetical protein